MDLCLVLESWPPVKNSSTLLNLPLFRGWPHGTQCCHTGLFLLSYSFPLIILFEANPGLLHFLFRVYVLRKFSLCVCV